MEKHQTPFIKYDFHLNRTVHRYVTLDPNCLVTQSPFMNLNSHPSTGVLEVWIILRYSIVLEFFKDCDCVTPDVPALTAIIPAGRRIFHEF